ncbi:nitroreductase family protein [Caenimonas sp. SL110]|uniref:nitroreductase family protein n=1 Tax=Caenimonas sp. SL110 TaxID=1450524 RepID=UPI0006546158|nr:nitroreductase family protein [Caenimonas sp. SL110]
MSPNDDKTLRDVLDLARWAPSGDNTQPWRFEIVNSRRVILHGFDMPSPCVYNLDYRAPRLAVGTLLETISLSAGTRGWVADIRRRPSPGAHALSFDIRFEPGSIVPDALSEQIRKRSVQRYPMSTKPLTALQKQTLESTLAPGYRIVWLESFAQRLQAARVAFHFAHLRLTLPEAYPVHSNIIEWNATESADRMPDRALGVNTPTLKLMRFVLQSWQRVQFFNRFLAGTWIPRLQMDVLPGLACAAHLVVLRDRPAVSVDEQVEAGRVVQRLWLTMTQLDLWHQPTMAPVLFSGFSKAGLEFSKNQSRLREAASLRERFERLIQNDCGNAIWMGRLGTGPAPEARAHRLPLEQLCVEKSISN